MTRLDRYGEEATEELELEQAHDPRCRNGWLSTGDDGPPTPCPACKPWLVACTTCGTSRKRCEFDRAKAGRCCPQCPHTPPGPVRRSRARATSHERSQA